MANRDIHQPDIIPERIELRPALSSTGDVPVFLQQTPEPEVPPEPAPTEPTDPLPVVDPAPPAEPDEPPAPKPDARTTRAREAEARAERLERLLEQSIQALTQVRQTAPEPPPAPVPVVPELPAPEPRPVRADYNDPEAYDAALVEWASTNATRRALAEHQAKLAEQEAAKKTADERAASERTQQEQGQALWNAHQDRRTKFIEAHPDYAEVVEQPVDLFDARKPGTQALVQAIARAEDGPAIAYYLAQNRTDESRITGLTDPYAVLIEVGKISAKLSQPKPVEVSRTPKPIEPLRGEALAAGKDPNEMTTEEYARHRGLDKPQYRPFLSSSGQRAH